MEWRQHIYFIFITGSPKACQLCTGARKAGLCRRYKAVVNLPCHWNSEDSPVQEASVTKRGQVLSVLENPRDGGAWWAAVYGVAQSQTRLSDFTFHFHALEKEMATHSSVLAWRLPGTGEPGGLLSMGSPRVRHDWSDLAAAAARRV